MTTKYREEEKLTQAEAPLAELYGWMKREIGTMPFLQLAAPQQDHVIRMNCRALYGKRYRGRMIASAKDFCDILMDEFKITAAPSQTEEMEDSVQVPLDGSWLQTKRNFHYLREMMEEIIQ